MLKELKVKIMLMIITWHRKRWIYWLNKKQFRLNKRLLKLELNSLYGMVCYHDTDSVKEK